MDIRFPIEGPEAAGRYLEALINLEKRPELARTRMSLSPIRTLLDRLGKPEQGMSILHVAGSKGKGSTCLFAERALTAAGQRVGVFTSPHLHSWTERFRVAGCEVDGDALAQAVSDLRPHVDWLRANDPQNAPTFFDATTAAALLIFARAGLDHVILEVGLGGRLDSTNVVTPRVCCISSIELEHTDQLGNTLAQIAAEKAGIIKPGIPCLIGPLAPAAEAVVRARADEVAAPVAALGIDFPAIAPDELAVLGRPQSNNAGLALEAARILARLADSSVLQAARKGLGETRLPGRLEQLAEDPLVIVDGAHTRASAAALADVLATRKYSRGRLLLSVSSGKNVGAILDALLPHIDEVVVTRAESQRSLTCEELTAAVRDHTCTKPVLALPDPDEAARQIRRRTASGELLVAAGSLYLAAVARAHWCKDR